MAKKDTKKNRKHPPLRPRTVDEKIRINELREKINEAVGKETTFYKAEDIPAAIEEQFLKQVLDYETAGTTTPFKKLTSSGLKLPPPDQVKDADVHDLLWLLIERMAKRRMFVTSTNHLSDRELYERLWSDALREEMPDVEYSKHGAYGIDMTGSGSEEDNEIYLKYYADAKARKRWKKDFPKYKMPPREDPPYDRDRHLPQMILEPPPEVDLSDLMGLDVEESPTES